MFFSAGEDGHVLQHDIRAPSNEISKILLNFSLVSNYAEAKCLSVNEVNPFQLAVGNIILSSELCKTRDAKEKRNILL